MVPRGTGLQRDVVVSLQELLMVDLYQVTNMSYLICPKIGFLRYPGRTYTPPHELFAGEDDDMNQSICTEKPIFTEKPMLSLLQGNLHPDQQKNP